MGTKLRRIQISMPESVEQAFVELAEAKDIPISKAIISILTEIEPQIRSATEYARLLKENRLDDAKRVIAHMLGDNLADFLERDREEQQKLKKGRSRD